MTSEQIEEMVRRNRRIAELEAELEAERAALPLLVKLAAREQRYACVDALDSLGLPGSAAQNAPCPDVARVLELWRAQRESDQRAR